MITGQGNGQGGREHGQKCDQLPGQRSIADPEARKHVAKVWGIQPEDIPQAGYSAMEIMEGIHRGEIKGLLCICFNPMVSLPDANFTKEALEKIEFLGVIDFFLSETAHYADVVLAGLGLGILPYRRRRAKAQFDERARELGEQLAATLREQFERELEVGS